MFDTVLYNPAGEITECTRGNIASCLDGRWVTPPLDAGILAGITRALLLQHLHELGETVLERAMSSDDLDRAEELFLSSTLRDVGPVTHLDGAPKNGGTAGPHTQRLMASFAEFLRRRMRTHDGPRWRQLVGE